MIKNFKVLCALIFFFNITACVMPYVEKPKLLGENPATLITNTKHLKSGENSASLLLLHRNNAICKGTGRAIIRTQNLGSFYSYRDDLPEKKILIPANKKIIVGAHHYSWAGNYITYCDIGLEFEPKPGAKYLYSTHKNEELLKILRVRGDCSAALHELVQNDKGEEEMVPVEVTKIPYDYYLSKIGQRETLFCDNKKNILTQQQWDEYKAQQKQQK
jgi:hypothetical protein